MVPISILLILGLLYSLFNSIRDSLVVLAGFLFAVAGGLIALFLSGEAFGISAAIGFVSLLGISVMNGILLITYFNEIRSGGVPARGGHVPGRDASHARGFDDGVLRLPSGCSQRRFRPPSAARCSARSPSSWSAACLLGRSCSWSSCPRCKRCFPAAEAMRKPKGRQRKLKRCRRQAAALAMTFLAGFLSFSAAC